MQTVTIGDLARITDRPVTTIRNMHNRDGTPWGDDLNSQSGRGRLRQYAVDHALALVLCEMIEGQGYTTPAAAEMVESQFNVIGLFLDDLDKGESPPTPRFVVALRMAVSDSLTGARWEPWLLYGHGTEGEVTDHILGAFARIGREVPTRDGRTTLRYIGGPHVAVAPVAEAYRLLQFRARDAGFLIDGRKITEAE